MTKRIEDIDAPLLESIQHMTAEEIKALQEEVETSGAADQLREICQCVEQFFEDDNAVNA